MPYVNLHVQGVGNADASEVPWVATVTV